MIASTSYYDLPYWASVSTPLDRPIRMHAYGSNCTSRKNWFLLAGIPCLVFEPETWNALDSIEAILAATSKEERLEASF